MKAEFRMGSAFFCMIRTKEAVKYSYHKKMEYYIENMIYFFERKGLCLKWDCSRREGQEDENTE